MAEMITGSFAKEIDRCAMGKMNIPSLWLMEHAATHVARAAEEYLEANGLQKKTAEILVCCGVGNNGADGLLAAALLREEGYERVQVLCCGSQEKASEEFRYQLDRVHRCSIKEAWCESAAGNSAAAGELKNAADSKNMAAGTFTQGAESTAEKREKAETQGKTANLPEVPGAKLDLLIDAVFGIGLKRQVEGIYAELIEWMNLTINQTGAYVISVDIPSGIDADLGLNLCGSLYPVHADETVTFGWAKTGHYLNYGYGNCGKLRICDIGYPQGIIAETEDDLHRAEIEAQLLRKKKHEAPDEAEERRKAAAMPNHIETTDTALPLFREELAHRNPRANKSDYHKLLIVAGSKGMAGAAYLCGLGAYRSGIGMVKYFGPEENRGILQSLLPEAMYESYDAAALAKAGTALENGQEAAEIKDSLAESLAWADSIIVGPGLSSTDSAKALLNLFLSVWEAENKARETAGLSPKQLILDADAINLIAKEPKLTALYGVNTVLTPHIGEMARLCGKETAEVKKHIVTAARDYAAEHGVNLVVKDCVSVVAVQQKTEPDPGLSINISGDGTLAKAGSGDVLSGVIAGVSAVLENGFETSLPLAVYLHGKAGELAGAKLGEHGTLARDLANAMPAAMQNA